MDDDVIVVFSFKFNKKENFVPSIWDPAWTYDILLKSE